MDLLERARCLAACPLFEGLAAAVVIRLAERAHVIELERGERRTADAVWIVARGSLAIEGDDASGGPARVAGVGSALGAIRVVRAEARPVAVAAAEPSALVGVAVDDMRDVLEADPAALTALAARLAALLSTEPDA